MRPVAVNVTEIHCQTIFLLTMGALAPPDCGAPTVQHPQTILRKLHPWFQVQEMVEESAAGCKCRNNCMSDVRLRRVAEGQYNVAGRTVFIRVSSVAHTILLNPAPHWGIFITRPTGGGGGAISDLRNYWADSKNSSGI